MAFIKGRRRTAWETFTSILRADPVLKREVKTWRTWSGDPGDIEDLGVAHMPYVKVTPHPDKMGFSNNQGHEASFLLDVEIGVEGTEAADIMDYWESIERAVYPTSLASFNVIQQRLTDAGIIDVEFTKAGWDVNNKGGQPLTGTGQIKLKYIHRNKGIQS